jgi:hypothetical protein
MGERQSRGRVFLLASLTLVCSVRSALATFHEWRFDEIYSNASGTVQFVELSDLFNGETLLGQKTLQSNGHTFTFPADLPPNTPTASQHLLLATPGYFNLLGVPKADYNLGVNNFFSTNGDTLNYVTGTDTITFTAPQLPTDGLHSLVRLTPETNSPVSTAVNTPTNVAGTSGAFPILENQNNRFDVNASNNVSPIDLAFVLDDLDTHSSHHVTTLASPPLFLDVSGDNFVSPIDALGVIDFWTTVPPASRPERCSLSLSACLSRAARRWRFAARSCRYGIERGVSCAAEPIAHGGSRGIENR